MEKSSSQIDSTKRAFNNFFKKDLYGRYDDPENIILSRGAWRDNVVRLPAFFRFCLNKTLDHNWIGYSDSLGHDSVYDGLRDWVNIGREEPYAKDQLVITMGNVASMGPVFRELREAFPEGELLTFEPFYPSVVKAASLSFPKIHTVSSLSESEEDVYGQIEEECKNHPGIKVLLLSNFIGVEGRIFSSLFWEKVFQLLEERDLYLVIDEGMWLEPLQYPEGVNSDRVIRVVSSSKKYGNPGMKMGYMLAPPWFRERYYEQASTSYGGPPSLLFLASEFMYQFEHAKATADQSGLERLAGRYAIDQGRVESLFVDFCETLEQNRAAYTENRGVFEEWVENNRGLFTSVHLFHGINSFVAPDRPQACYPMFEELVQREKVSIFPSSCMGDSSDRMCRITILETQDHVREGLDKFSDFLTRGV
jgi:aspartate/methionine/tyrosine aminotransferase